MTKGEHSPSEGTSERRRATATFVFVAAAFGAMAMLSVPLARLIPSPVRPFFTFAAPIEGLPHPSRGSISTHEAGGRHATPRAHPAAAVAPAVPAGSGPIGTKAPAPAPVPLAPASFNGPAPADRIAPDLGIRQNGGQTLSPSDLRTLSALNLLVDRFGFRVLMPLRDAGDLRTSTTDLLSLIARNGISALRPGVTATRLHALLDDLRKNLPGLVRDLRRTPPPSPSRTTGAPPTRRPEHSSRQPSSPKRRQKAENRKAKPEHRRKHRRGN